MIGLLCLVGLFAIGWVMTGNDLAMKKVFAPAYEQVRHDTYKQSASYRDGMVMELRKAQMEYLKATPEQQAALATVIKMQFSEMREADIPTDLRLFLRGL